MPKLLKTGMRIIKSSPTPVSGSVQLLARRTGYDIVVPSIFFLERQAKAGIFLPLDKSKLPNLEHLDPELMRHFAQSDLAHKFSVPYLWGTAGIGYNKAMIRERLGLDGITSWEVLFKPEMAAKLKGCGIASLDSPAELLSSALAYLGIDPNSEKQEDLTKGMALLKQLRPYVKYFHPSRHVTDLASGAICIAFGYNGDALQARMRAEEAKNGVSIAYTMPQEGAILWFDGLAIPKDAPHPENAHIFINFILRPEVMSAITDKIRFANPNAAAFSLIAPEVKEDSAIYPPPSTIGRLFLLNPHSTKFDRLLTRAWTEMKTGH